MVKLNNAGAGEILVRSSITEPLIKAKLAKNVWVGGVQFIKTFDAENLNDYLFTETGSPSYNVNGVINTIKFNTSLDVAMTRNGVSCRKASGSIRNVDTNYSSATESQKYIFVCNFVGKVSTAMTLTKRSHGIYETEYKLSIACGENYNEWIVAQAASGSFEVGYNGSAYVASYTVKPTVGSQTYSVTSENCREQVSRLELAGSVDAYGPTNYTGLYNLNAILTTGMSKY